MGSKPARDWSCLWIGVLAVICGLSGFLRQRFSQPFVDGMEIEGLQAQIFGGLMVAAGLLLMGVFMFWRKPGA